MIPRARLWYLLRIGLIGAVIIILFFSGLFPVEEWFSAFSVGNLSASVAASDVASLTNEQRIENGLAPLNVSPLLSQAAELKAQDMARYSYYSHTGPDGKSPLSWLNHVGYRYLNAGENLVIDRTSASEAVGAWMNSSEHRENILRPQFTEIGVGVAEGEYEGVSTIFVVEEFGTPYPTYTAPRSTQPKIVTHTQVPAVLPSTNTAVSSETTGASVTIPPQITSQSAPVTVAATLPIPVLPKIASLASAISVRTKPIQNKSAEPQKNREVREVTAAATTTASSSVSSPDTSTSTVTYALAPEFFKPVTIPQTLTRPAAPKAVSQTRFSVWVLGIRSYFNTIFRF